MSHRQEVGSWVPVIFSVVGVNFLVLFLPHVFLESGTIFECLLTK